MDVSFPKKAIQVTRVVTEEKTAGEWVEMRIRIRDKSAEIVISTDSLPVKQEIALRRELTDDEKKAKAEQLGRELTAEDCFVLTANGEELLNAAKKVIADNGFTVTKE